MSLLSHKDSRSRSLSRGIKIQLYTTLLRSIIIYEAETWSYGGKETDCFRVKNSKKEFWSGKRRGNRRMENKKKQRIRRILL